MRGKSCATRSSNLRVRVNSTNYVYPDVTVTCGDRKFADGTNLDTLINPTVVFEILSDSIEHRDRGFKWKLYQQIESLRHYVLVDQHTPRVEVYTRQTEADWLMHTETRLDGVISLAAIEIDLPMSAIYEEFTFESAPAKASEY